MANDDAAYVLYGANGSGSASVEVALTRCGLPFELRNTARWEPDEHWEELLTVNPLGQIPTLILPDGSVLTESAAILIHLGLTRPACGLLPEEPSRRAQAIRALVYVAANCYSAITVIDYPERFTVARTRPARERIRQGARAQLHRNWEIFADQFTAEPFLCGARPGAADIFASVVSRWSGARAHLAVHRPALASTLRRIDSWPEFAPVFERHWPG